MRYGQYLLDNAATVSDALKLMYGTQVVAKAVAGRVWPFHLAIEDASGDSAVVEFVKDPITGKGIMHVYHGTEYTVLTNDPTFDQQIANLWQYQYFGFGGGLTLPGDCNAKSRFVRASAFLSSLNAAFSHPALKPDPISSMFLAIRSISEPFGAYQFVDGDTAIPAWPTLWTLVYNLTNKKSLFYPQPCEE